MHPETKYEARLKALEACEDSGLTSPGGSVCFARFDNPAPQSLSLLSPGKEMRFWEAMMLVGWIMEVSSSRARNKITMQARIAGPPALILRHC